MTQGPERTERTVIINAGERGGSGGMGTGVILGIVLVVVLAIGMAWFVMAGNMGGKSGATAPVINGPTINIETPKIPDSITINTPANPPVAAPAP